MKNEKKLQNKEIKNVGGGSSPFEKDIRCPDCGCIFKETDIIKKETSGCHIYYTYKCPKCGRELTSE